MLVLHKDLVRNFKELNADRGMYWLKYTSSFGSFLGYDAGNGWIDIDDDSIISPNINELMEKLNRLSTTQQEIREEKKMIAEKIRIRTLRAFVPRKNNYVRFPDMKIVKNLITEEEHVITAASELIGGENGKVNFNCQFSFCSPRDQFNRKKGKLIALGRLEKHPIPFSIDVNKNEKALKKIVECLISEAKHRNISVIKDLKVEDLYSEVE